jgi:hypothetical protein
MARAKARRRGQRVSWRWRRWVSMEQGNLLRGNQHCEARVYLSTFHRCTLAGVATDFTTGRIAVGG